MVKYEDRAVITLNINGDVHKVAVRPQICCLTYFVSSSG